MPPRHAYWTILIDDQPTAFRAHDPEELLPTLNRLREKNASAVMKWFERGQLFDSRDAAREAGLGKGERRWEGPRPERPVEGAGERRERTWRPGGEHRDPRQKYKDAKKAKWNRFKDKIRERHEQRLARDPETFSPPHGDPLRDKYNDPAPRRAEDREDRPPRRDTRREDRDGAPTRPHGDKYRPARPRGEWRPRPDDDRRPPAPRESQRESRQQTRPPRSDERRSDWRDQRRADWRDDTRTEWRDRPPRRDDDRRSWKPKPAGSGAGAPERKPFGAKPGGRPPTGQGRKPAFGKKPFGKKPFGSKPFGGKPSGRKPFGGPSTGRRRRDEDE